MDMPFEIKTRNFDDLMTNISDMIIKHDLERNDYRINFFKQNWPELNDIYKFQANGK